jgi:hypothetical protein
MARPEIALGFCAFQDGTWELIIQNTTTHAEHTLTGSDKATADRLAELLPMCVFEPAVPIVRPAPEKPNARMVVPDDHPAIAHCGALVIALQNCIDELQLFAEPCDHETNTCYCSVHAKIHHAKAAIAAATGRAHILFTNADPVKPAAICDRNGEVVLEMCRVCGRYEAALEDPFCPGAGNA